MAEKRSLVILTGDKPDFTRDSTVERTQTYSTGNTIVELDEMAYQGVIRPGPGPVFSATPGQLERLDLEGKPQDIAFEENEIGEDVIGSLVPSQLAMTLEAAFLWTRSDSQLDHRTVSLEHRISDVGVDGGRVISVLGKAKHSDPLMSEQYEEDTIPRMEKDAEGMPSRR